MAALHIVSNPRAIGACLRAQAAGDPILLIGDGVFALDSVPEGHELWVLAEDAAQRGVGVPPSADADYAKFVSLVLQTHASVTWS